MISLDDTNKLQDRCYYIRKALGQYVFSRDDAATLKEIRKLANDILLICETIEAKNALANRPEKVNKGEEIDPNMFY